jgi:hypothetical protein
MERLRGDWKSLEALVTSRFTCGHCGNRVSSDRGYYAFAGSHGNQTARAYLCHDCNRLTLIDDTIKQIPAPMLGRSIKKLPDDIESLYAEMRKASADGAYSLVVMGGRKLLMHIAVSLGAEEGKKFVQYVSYLETNHYTPPKSSTWVKEIKDMGNESNHELVVSTKEDADKIIKFLDLLMTFNYEFADEEDTEESESDETPE